jgi:hypothetical protein
MQNERENGKSLAEFRPEGERYLNHKSRRQVRRDLFCADRKRASGSESPRGVSLVPAAQFTFRDAAGCKKLKRVMYHSFEITKSHPIRDGFLFSSIR